jgi:UDP-N-acetylmuramate--alanine ligase
VAVHEGRTLGQVRLAMPGRHNVVNSLAAIAVGREFNLPFAAIRDGLAKFGGVARRFEVRGEHGGVIVVDDYGHHPTEIAAVLSTARAAWPDRRVVVVFQPHRYTRTRDLLARFGAAFGDAGLVILAPIYAAGEKPIPGVSSAGVGVAIEQGSQVPVIVAGDLTDAGEILAREARAGDVVLTLGAGYVWRLGEAWLAGDCPAAGAA